VEVKELVVLLFESIDEALKLLENAVNVLKVVLFKVLNCWIVPKSSNFPKILLGKNSNCLPLGMFVSLSLVISYCFW
jgi:hypothetical protein